MRTNYRKIYEHHYGPIPTDRDGRSYHIHHIDGDRANNRPDNLEALPIKNHYEKHRKQKDYGACLALARLMKRPLKEISEASRLVQQQRIKKGTHNFQDREAARQRNIRRINEGSHPFLREGFQSQAGNISVEKSLRNGTHPFLDKSAAKTRAISRVRNKTHNFQLEMTNGTHNTFLIHTCPKCGLAGKGPIMFRHHFDNCREKK